MAGKNTSAFGIYKSRASAESAIETLKNRGFRSEDISVLLPENLGSKDIETEKATKAPEGAAAGAGTGLSLAAPWDCLLASPAMRKLLFATDGTE